MWGNARKGGMPCSVVSLVTTLGAVWALQSGLMLTSTGFCQTSSDTSHVGDACSRSGLAMFFLRKEAGKNTLRF